MLSNLKIKGLLEYQEDDREQGVVRSYLYYTKTGRHLHTQKQNVDLIETNTWGKMLFLDGVLQSTTRDEAIYHNALVHPLMDVIQSKGIILILGGGEGATAREVLRWRAVKHVTMVDYDQELVDFIRRYGPEWSMGAFCDPRLMLQYEDAWDYIMNKAIRYDGVIIDLTDPEVVDDKSFSMIESALNIVHADKGAFVINAGHYIPWDTRKLKELENMVKFFCSRSDAYTYIMYTAFVPSFNGDWTFIMVYHSSCKTPDPENLEIIPDWIRRKIRVLDSAMLDHSEYSLIPTTSPIG